MICQRGIGDLTTGSRSRATKLSVWFGKAGCLIKSKGYAMKTILTAAAVAVSLVTPAAALEPLSQNKVVNGKLAAARIADLIRRECDDIDGRLVYAWGQARALKKYAKNQGYSDAQIEDFLDSKPDKARIYGEADRYIAEHGAKRGDAKSLCALGHAEIAANSFIGSFLRAR